MLTDKSYDVIIIGSGCGGTASAALMSYLGFKTLLLEKNRAMGGRTSTYEKDGFKLDHGHVIMRCEKGPHGDVLRIVKRKDLIPRFTHWKRWPLKAVVGDAHMEISPNLPAMILNFSIWEQVKGFKMTLWEKIRLLHFMAKVLVLSDKKIHELDGIGMETYLSRFVTNKYAHLMIGAIATVGFGALTEESSAGEMVRVLKAGTKDNGNMGYPVTGEGIFAIPNSFLKAARACGCHVETNSPVTGVLIENNQVKGVRVNGDTILAPHVISNIGVRETVTKLVGTDYFDPDYARKIENLKYSYGGISLKYAVNRKVTQYTWGGEVPENLGQVTMDMMAGRLPEKFPMMFVSPSNIDPMLAPKDKQVLSFISGGPAVSPGKVDWDPWVENMKKQAEAFIPGLKENTCFCEVSTPDQIARYTGRMVGDAVGVSQTVDQVGDLRPSPISPIQGLYYAGADVGRNNFATELASQSAIKIYKHFKVNNKQK